MKKQLSLVTLSILIIALMVYTADGQKGNKNENKEKKQDHGKNGENKDKKDKDDKGKGKDEGKGHDDKDKGNKDKNHNEDHGNGKDDDKDHKNKDKDHVKYVDYNWNHETFKDRDKIKNQDKVTICHKFNNNNEPAVTLSVSAHAMKAHMNHGDVMGSCPAVTNTSFSSTYLSRRNDYYTVLENGQEQVVYSKSILEYALERLNGSRAQLVTLQSNNMPQAEIQRKQATVVELEQNVTLLQSLIGVAANLLLNKLQ